MPRPYDEMPLRMPAMASSQMPPTESSRASGFVCAFQKPGAKSAAMVLTLVEPRRSAEAVRKAPPEAAFRCWRARPSSPRRVVDEPGVRRSSSGIAATDAAASSQAASARGAPGRGVRARRSRRSRAARSRAASASAAGRSAATRARTTSSAAQKHSSRTASPRALSSRAAATQRCSSASQVGRTTSPPVSSASAS